MTAIQLQLYDAIVRTNAAKLANDPDWIHHDRERSRLLYLRQAEMMNERMSPPVQFERVPDAAELADLRTDAERNLDEWQADWQDTYNSLRDAL